VRDTDLRQPTAAATVPAAGMERDRYETIVIGAGQAGLGIGYFLARQGRRFTILEASDAVGAAWRARWESLVLFTPRRYSALAGLAFPGDPDGYPTRDDVIAYLDEYAERFELPVQLESSVRSVERAESGFVVRLEDRELEADQVVIATGPFQIPRIPEQAGGLSSEVFQAHSTAYMRPADVPAGRVLVVGGGNTGYQIAKELAKTHSVHLAIGSRQTPLPQRLFGRDLFWWLTKSGLIKKTVDSRLAQRARQRDTLIGSSPRRLERQGIDLRPRVVSATTTAVAGGPATSVQVQFSTSVDPATITDRKSVV